MSKIAVIYKSKYGASKRYAQWIAEELNASLFDVSGIKPSQLTDYDVVIYGGGLYAGVINGVRIVSDNLCKTLVVFTVGLTDPETTDYSEILAKNFKTEYLQKIKVFHLRGGADLNKLSLIHKGMIAMLKKIAVKKLPADRTNEEHAILEISDGNVDFSDKSAIDPLVEYVRTMLDV